MQKLDTCYSKLNLPREALAAVNEGQEGEEEEEEAAEEEEEEKEQEVINNLFVPSPLTAPAIMQTSRAGQKRASYNEGIRGQIRA